MKQYVRITSGHILKIKNKQKRLNGEYDTWYCGRNSSILYDFNHDVIVKEADTIEELCDEIVIVENGSHSIPAYIEEAINRFMEDCEFGNNNIQIYGAIWTDKGLIYVAKMNDKGELELI